MPLVYFIRHAESQGNVGGRAPAHPSLIPLTEKGHAQARALAAKIPEPPSLIVASAYIRTQLTAQPLRERYPSAPFELWPVQEFTYLSTRACANTLPAERRGLIDAYWKSADPDLIAGLTPESFNQMLSRVRHVLKRLEARPDSDFVTVFSHGQLMNVIRFMHERPGLLPEEMMRRFPAFGMENPVNNCGILKLQIEKGRVEISRRIEELELLSVGF